MSPTDVHCDGTVAADCSKCVHVLSITFSQSLKHDGTASERRHCKFVLQRQEISTCTAGETEGPRFR